jgi:VCBS repeat-containing protein
MTHFFNLTPGIDTFTGVAGDYNAFQLTPATLQSGDTVTGGATGSFFDVLVVTATGTIAGSQFTGVTNIEQLNLFSGGNNVTLTNGLVAGTSTGFFTVLDGGGNDTIDASAVGTKPIVFYAAGGSDTFKGGGGNDAIVIAAANLTSADTIQGGAGIDNLYFSTAGTVAAAAFTNVSGIEGIGLSSLGNNITLTNAMVASSNNGGFSVSDGAGDDTVDASGVTNGTPIAFFASGGADTFKGGNGPNGYVFVATDLTSADTVQGGAGASDNLFITTAGTLSAAAFTNVTGIEGLILANGTNNVTLTNGLVAGTAAGYFAVAGGTGNDTVNASAVTNGTAIAFYGTTGGNDTFTGGNGNDSFLFGAGQLTSADTVAGGGGNDTLWMTTAGTTSAAALANVTGIEGVFLQVGGSFTLANGITGAASFAAVGSSAVDTFDASAVTGYKVTFAGNGGADVLKGGSQDDTFFISDSAFASINGNGGIDRITLIAASQSFDLHANVAKITNLEVIDLNSSLNSTLTLAGTDIAQVNASGTSLYVIGDVDDTVNAGNGYTQIASGVVNNAVAPGHTFFEYQHSSGSLLFIDSAITAQTATTGNGSASVPEGTAGGATVFNAGMAGATTYVLGGADAALFSIDGAGHISFNASPDFETPHDQGANNVYDVTVTSSNGTATPNFVESVAITVTDINDNAPVFTSGATATTPENVATTTPVYTAHATDADASSTVSYALASGGDNSLFDINSATGAVTFKVSPDFENPQDTGHDNGYDISVIASDGVPAHDTTKAVTITVTDVNDPPVITSNGGGDTASVNVNENSTAVTTVTATDPDVPAQTLTYSVVNGAGSPDATKFGIDGSGHLFFLSAPDFEAPGSAASSNTYTVQVLVADSGAPTMHDIQTITVNVQDANDIAPTFTSIATPTVVENSTAVVDLTTMDPDTVGTNPATFSITGGADQGLFTITGGNHLEFITPRDYETQAHSYAVQVTANDGTNNTVQNITVALTDANDNAPIFSSGTTASTPENVATTTPVYTAIAPDADLTAANNTVTYSLASGGDNDLFNIDANSGAVTFKASPDFEAPADAGADNQYDITVTASDGLAAHDTTQAVAITVTDVNDNAPVFGSPTATANADEGTSTSTVVFTASATDADGTAANNTIAYSLGGADGALFNINSATGEVTFAASPNFETPADAGADNHYDFTVTASDGVPAHDATQAVTITVADVAPSTPVDSDTATADSVSQNATVGTYTGITASSTDVNGPAVTWSLTNDTSGGGFGIDSTGKITVIDSSKIVFNPADATHEFSVRAIASDGTLSSHQDFTITVVPNTAPTANDDAASATEAGGLNNTIAGTNPSGNVITAVGPGDVADTDPDAGDSVTVVAAGTGTEASPTGPGTVNTAFNGQHGSLLIHTDGSYTYTVDQSDAAVQALRLSTDTITDSFNYTIQDNGGLQDVATLTVTIHGANDNPIANADSVVAVEAGGVANGTPGTNPGGNVITGAGTAGAVADTDVDSAANGETTTVVGVATGSPGGPLSGNVGVGVASLNGYGTLTIGADGTYSYVVDNSNASVQALRTSAQTLTDTFSYTISDAAGAKSTTTVTVTIDGANDAPVAHADVLSATEAGGVANGTPGVNPSGNVITGTGSPGAVADTDADSAGNGEVLSVVGLATGTQSGPLSGNVGGAGLVSANGYGTLTIGTDGTYSYVVDNSNTAVQGLRTSGQTLTDTFSYTLSDAAGATSTTTVQITIHGANDNPVANADAFTAIEAGGLANGAAGSNPSGNVLTGTGSPTAVADTDVDSAANGETTTVVGVAAGTPGGPISGNVGAGVVTANGYGTLTIAADGTYGYVVNQTNATVQGLRTSAQTLTDTFSYTISDAAGAKSTTTVTITIDGANDNPVANDDNVTATETSGTANGTAGHNPTGNLIAGTGGNGEAADTDVDTTANGETTTVQGVAAGNTGTVAQNVDPSTGIDVVGAHGTLHVNANGTYTYTVDNTAGNTVDQLNTGGSLPDQFTYTVKDTAGATSTAHVNITIHGADDAPVAVADSYVAFENRAFTPTAATGVLANDTDVDTAHTSLTAVLNSGPSHQASFTLNADGSFSYTPTAGYLGGDSFTYHTSDGSLVSSTVTVAIDVQPLVWHIDNTAAAGGDGSAAHPFDSIAAFNAANAAVGTHPDIVYLHAGTGTYSTTDGINLNNGQTLLGQGVDLTYTTSASAPGGAHLVTLLDADNSVTPTISVTGGAGNAGVTLAQGNSLSGFNISTTSADGIGIEDSNAAGTAGSVGTLHIDTVGISGTGKAIDIDQGGTLSNVHLTSIASTGSNSEGIQLGGIAGSTLGGSFTVDGTTSITNADTTGIQVSTTAAGASFNFGSSTTVTDNAIGSGHNGNGIDFTTGIGATNSFTLGTASITTDGGFGLAANGGTVNIGGTASTINATGGAAVDLTNTSLGSGATFATVSSTNSTGTGIQITGLSTGNFTANGGAISSATGTDVSINGGTSSITYNGTITDDLGQLVSVANKTGGTVAFGGAITDGNDGDGSGISLTNNTGATINFTGGTTLSTGANNAFTATGGGTVNVTGTNHLTTTTGTALNITGTTIGASGVTFQDISANGAVNGIVLNNTGSSGGLTVTGDSGSTKNGSGGTIQNTTGDGVSLTTTQNVSLDQLNIQSTGGSGVNGVGVTNFALTNSTVNNSGNALLESNIAFNGSGAQTGNSISGTLTITGNTLTNAFYSGVDIQGDSGTISDANISNNTITSSTVAANTHGSGIDIAGTGNASTAFSIDKASINNNIITNFPSGDGINFSVGNANASGPQAHAGTIGSGTNVITINNNTVHGQSTANPIANQGIAVVDTSGNPGARTQVNAVVSTNDIQNTFGTSLLIGNNGYSDMAITVDHNTIVGVGEADLGGANGIGGGNGVGGAGTAWTPHLTAIIESNNVSGTDGNGILMVNRATNGEMDVKIDNNTVAMPTNAGGTARQGIRVDAGNNTAGEDASVFLNIFGNTTTGSNGAAGIGVRKNGTVATTNDFGIFDAAGGPTLAATPTNTDVSNFINALNPNSASAGNGGTDIISGNNYLRDTTHAPTLLAASGGVQASSTPSPTHDLTQAELDTVVVAAIGQWASAGASAAQLAALHAAAAVIQVGMLDGNTVGTENGGLITIDTDAAGHGWFVDPTPNDNSEFTHAQNAAGTDLLTDPSNAAAGHLDLLTTVTHELGHVLGLDDETAASDANDLMYINLVDGERRMPDATDVAQANGANVAQVAEAALPASAQAAIGTAIVAATVGNDTIDAGHGGNILVGGAGADNFVFGPSTPLDAPTPAQITHVADYSAAQGDTFDFSAITSAFHNSSVSDSLVVRAVEDASGKFATLQVDHIDPMGLPSAPNWVNVAQLDGAHSGDAVNVLIDNNHSVHLAQIHVDLLV